LVCSTAFSRASAISIEHLGKLPLNSRAVIAVAKAGTLTSVYDLAFPIMVGAAKKR